MLESIVRLAVLVVLAWLSLSCVGQYAPPKLNPGPKPDPVQDFIRLRALFKQKGGDLVTPEDQTVTWKDTPLFRMFEFKHHTVVVFPYNWTPKQYNVILVAGHLKPEQNPFDALKIQHTYPPNERFWTDGINWDFDCVLGSVSFVGFQLGQPRSEVIENQRAYIQREWPRSVEQREVRIGVLDIGEGTATWGEREGINLRFVYESGRLAFMSFNPTEPKWAVTLSEYAIMKPSTPVEDEGVFAVPRTQNSGK